MEQVKYVIFLMWFLPETLKIGSSGCREFSGHRQSMEGMTMLMTSSMYDGSAAAAEEKSSGSTQVTYIHQLGVISQRLYNP